MTRVLCCLALSCCVAVGTSSAQELPTNDDSDRPYLSELSAEELAEFPWLDLHLAESILEFHAASPLRRWEDLRAIPGMTPVTIDLLRSLVRLDSPPQMTRRLAARGRVDDDGAWRGDGGLEIGPVEAGAVAGPRAWRAWSSWSFDSLGLRVWAGALALKSGFGLGEARASSSRSAPTAIPRPAYVRPHAALSRDPDYLGAAMEWRQERCSLHAVASADGRSGGFALEVEALPGSQFGARVDIDDARSSLRSQWWRARLPDGTRWHLERARGRATALALRRPVGADWEAGLATSAGEPNADGIDPISGRRLDRSHRAWQVSARRRWRSGSGTFLLRELRRGSAQMSPETRLQLEMGGGLRHGRWLLRLRQDTEAAASDGSLRARWEGRRGGFVHRMALSLVQSAAGLGRLFEVGVFAGEFLRWGAQVAFSDAERSILHVVSVPGSGARPRWLSGGQADWSAGLELVGPRHRLGVWLRSPMRPSQLEGGLSCRIDLE